MENKSWSFKQVILLLLSALILYLILFTKWLGVDLFYSRYSTTLLKIGEVMSNLSGYLESGPKIVIPVLIYGLLIVCALSFVLTFKSIFTAHQTGESISKAGFKFSIILSALVLIAVLIINLLIRSETDGYVSGLFKVEAPTYITLALGCAGYLLCDKKPGADGASSGFSIFNSVYNAVSFIAENAAEAARDTIAPQRAASETAASTDSNAPIRKCESCGWSTNNSDVQFCAHCGARLATELRCHNCGKTLEPGMRFCPYCAAELKK